MQIQQKFNRVICDTKGKFLFDPHKKHVTPHLNHEGPYPLFSQRKKNTLNCFSFMELQLFSSSKFTNTELSVAINKP